MFLFYGRTVDPTLLTALSELSSAQATATAATKRACHQFLVYCASHPASTICYHTSDMQIKLHSDSSYLNAVGARSRQGGHFFLGNKSDPDILNGAILHLAAIMKMVLSSAAKAEFGALFHNTKEATPLCTTLEELRHPQPPTPVLVDNSTAVGLANNTVTQRRSRAIDMRFYWVRDRIDQNQFHVYWAPAHLNPPITSPNITHPPTTTKCANTSSTPLIAQSSFRLHQHDVLWGCVNPNRDSPNGYPTVKLAELQPVTLSH